MPTPLRKRRSASHANANQSSAAAAPPTWWRYLFEEAEDAQVVCDTQGVLVETNRRAANQLGLTQQTHLFKCGLLATPSAERLQQLLANPEPDPSKTGTVPSVSRARLPSVGLV